ncbi:MAG: hypothetical protein Q9157_007389 [Trypethelium eluteriae]
MTQQVAPTSLQARKTLQEAFERFSRSVTPEERRDFSSTSLEDVRNAAVQTERQLAARRSLRNMRRLHPFLQGLERYSKSIEVLCNGTPYLPWIWVSLGHMLRGALANMYCVPGSNQVDDPEAYGRIADTLPRFDRLSSALKADHNFQAVLAFFYGDILEFHRRTYKFVRRSGESVFSKLNSWKTFFNSMWGGFDSRFSSILARLSYHSELVDKEAIAVNVAEATERRKEQTEQWEKDDQERQAAQLVRVLSWLGLSGNPQADEIDRISKACQPNSCAWVTEHSKIRLWMKDSPTHALVWLHGKPGAGKSVLCSNLVKSMQSSNANVFYYFFNYRVSVADSSAYLLRSLAAQIIQKSPDLVAYVHDEFVLSHFTPSLKALRDLLPRILASNSHSHLVIDGIDECDSNDQKFITDDALQLLSTDTSSHICKILISTRDVPNVARILRRKTKLTMSLSLADEHQSINLSIECFIRTRLSELKDDLDELDPTCVARRDIQRKLVEKADGMFLWVSLVLNSLESVYSPQELHEIVEDLPSDLSELYERILRRICDERNPRNKERASRILRWICYSKRPLTKFELLPASALHSDGTILDASSLPNARLLEICKPLIEERSDGSVTFVHFSVQEFLMKSATSVFFRPLESHCDISFACMATLSSGLDLVDPESTEQSRLRRIVSGVHGLIPYAIENWIEHLFLYASTGGAFEQDRALFLHLSSFLSKHNNLLHLTKVHEEKSAYGNEHASFNQLDKRLRLLAHLPIHDLVREILHMRWLARQEACESGEAAETYAFNHDRTLFTKLAMAFNCGVLSLLGQKEVPGVATLTLDAFKQLYASSAFRCRYPSCPKVPNSFASDRLRTQHEATHLRRIFCQVSECQWNRIGFKSHKGLRTHMRSHDEKAMVPIPAKVRRMANEKVDASTAKDSEPGLKGNQATSNQSLSSSAPTPSDVDDMLGNLQLDDVSEHYKTIGDDWHCIYNPRYLRELDVKPVHTFIHQSVVTCICFSWDGFFVATGSKRSTQIFNVVTGQLCMSLVDNYLPKYNDLSIQSVCFSSDGRDLATGADDGIVRIWQVPVGRIRYRLMGHTQDIRSVDFAKNASIVALGSGDCKVRLWSTTTGQLQMTLSVRARINSVAISDNGRWVAAGLLDNSARVWDTSTGVLVWHLGGTEFDPNGHHGGVCSVCFDPDGLFLFTASRDKTVKMWDLTSYLGSAGQCVRTFKGHIVSAASWHCETCALLINCF